MRKIPKLEGMEYPLGERNEVATFSLVDESTYARKIDDISPDAQVAGESNTTHLITRTLGPGWTKLEVQVKRSESKNRTFRASAELGILSSSQVELQ